MGPCGAAIAILTPPRENVSIDYTAIATNCGVRVMVMSPGIPCAGLTEILGRSGAKCLPFTRITITCGYEVTLSNLPIL